MRTPAGYGYIVTALITAILLLAALGCGGATDGEPEDSEIVTPRGEGRGMGQGSRQGLGDGPRDGRGEGRGMGEGQRAGQGRGMDADR